jgi:hypothetical protein
MGGRGQTISRWKCEAKHALQPPFLKSLIIIPTANSQVGPLTQIAEAEEEETVRGVARMTYYIRAVVV